MDEACRYFSAQAEKASRFEELVTMTGFQDNRVYKNFAT